MGLVGASGSGKSTLLNLLAGLADADTGAVWLDGERVQGPSEVLVAGHPRIRLVHQEYQLMPNISVRENISYALRFFDKTYRDFRVDQLLRLSRLMPVQYHTPKQLSGGEKQRVAIARVVAEKPTDGRTTVLLLDEPFSHLDLPNRLIAQRMLLDLVHHDRVACLFVTHDATDALALAHTLGIMQQGRLVQLGPPQTVYQQPLTGYVAQLTGPANLLRASHLPLLGLATTQPDHARCCLRPEHIRLTDTGIAATVRTVFFKGSFSEVEVAVTPQVRVRVLTHRHDLQPGQPIHIQADEAALWWLKA